LTHTGDLSQLLAGRTVVGGLIGGTLGIIIAKRLLHLSGKTGNLFAPAIALGIAVWRIGCFLHGCCGGVPTTMPWGINFGDGIPRHPTQLYEVLFLGLLALLLWRRSRRPYPTGDLFKGFMVGYLGWRFLIDFFKPYPAVFLGLGSIQWVCLLTLAYYAPHLPRLLGPKTPAAPPHAEG
jgi:prolipoprotein diacylglyceryltransferase